MHRTEWEDRKKKLGYEWEYQRRAWAPSLQPTLYDLAANAYGPFDRSLNSPMGVMSWSYPAQVTPGGTWGSLSIPQT